MTGQGPTREGKQPFASGPSHPHRLSKQSESDTWNRTPGHHSPIAREIGKRTWDPPYLYRQPQELGWCLSLPLTQSSNTHFATSLSLLMAWLFILTMACSHLLGRWSVASELHAVQQSSSMFLLRTAEMVTGAASWTIFRQKAPACDVQCGKWALPREHIFPLQAVEGCFTCFCTRHLLHSPTAACFLTCFLTVTWNITV